MTSSCRYKLPTLLIIEGHRVQGIGDNAMPLLTIEIYRLPWPQWLIKIIRFLHHHKYTYSLSYIWGPLRQKKVSGARTSNHMPQYLWDVITYPSPWHIFRVTYDNHYPITDEQMNERAIGDCLLAKICWSACETETWISDSQSNLLHFELLIAVLAQILTELL